MILATIQTFGTAATTISQMTWSGVRVSDNSHLARSAEKLHHILARLEKQIGAPAEGFLPGSVSVKDIFLAAHVHFIQARPLDIDVGLERFAKIAALLDRLDERESFEAIPSGG
ncbi:glutathione S-transferase C-terminal domain-containing protein [uncultured Ruegeria sp.]|uniref:glutathione S-transferase C-terminal domain-containing protein n=1 Tax=uncultured Ruegeria sp. TaxID=259304 RepID=UPI0026328DD2|nr:glutathione S-transferase C-terminal domain-containing protein [uncultured Ruegeria sp.]